MNQTKQEILVPSISQFPLRAVPLEATFRRGLPIWDWHGIPLAQGRKIEAHLRPLLQPIPQKRLTVEVPLNLGFGEALISELEGPLFLRLLRDLDRIQGLPNRFTAAFSMSALPTCPLPLGAHLLAIALQEKVPLLIADYQIGSFLRICSRLEWNGADRAALEKSGLYYFDRNQMQTRAFKIPPHLPTDRELEAAANAESEAPSIELKEGLPSPLERAFLIAATGRHHLLIGGPKGIGKSASMKWMQWLGYAMRPEKLPLRTLLYQEALGRPVNSGPDSTAAILTLTPTTSGQILALKKEEFATQHPLLAVDEGLLIAEDFADWSPRSKEFLKAPLEEAAFVIAGKNIFLPIHFQFVGTTNLCACGGWPSKSGCRCTAHERRRYFARIPGPLLDRIDLFWMYRGENLSRFKPSTEHLEFQKKRMLEKIKAARLRLPRIRMSAGLKELLVKKEVMEKNLHARRERKRVEIARTLCALESADSLEITTAHWREASLYQPAIHLAAEEEITVN